MDIDVQKLAELKKQFEKIVGHEIDLSEEQLLAGSFPFASSTYLARHDDDNNAWVAIWRIVFPTGCTDSELLDTSGRSATGPDGKIVFRLSNFLCGRLNSFAEPVNLVATPQGTEPFYVTMNHELIKAPPPLPFYNDVQITAFAWNHNGRAAPNVSFYWRCRVVAPPVL